MERRFPPAVRRTFDGLRLASLKAAGRAADVAGRAGAGTAAGGSSSSGHFELTRD